MNLNAKFDKSLEDIINSFQPLADWFERNQKAMINFAFTNKDCLHFEGTRVDSDIIALGRMASAGLTCLGSKLPISAMEKAKFATFAIANVYNREQFNLSDNAKAQYYIDIEPLQEKQEATKSI